MNSRCIRAVVKKDILDASKNYHILLLVATPIILSLLFSSLFSEAHSKSLIPRIGIIAEANHPLLKQFNPQKLGINLVFCENRLELETKIIESDVTLGLIFPIASAAGNGNSKPQLTLIYSAETPEFLVERFQKSFEDEIRKFFSLAPPPLPIEITWEPIGGRSEVRRNAGNDMFPMLVLMAMAVIGLLGLPLSMAEEREHKTLEALFLTPITYSELIIGKCLYSFFIQIATIFVMVTLNGHWNAFQIYFWIVAGLGSIMFLLIGLFVSSVAGTQGMVNALGSALFLLFQMVPTLSSTSESIKILAALLPSTYILRGIKKALFLDLSKVNITTDIFILLFAILVCYIILQLSFKRLEVDTTC